MLNPELPPNHRAELEARVTAMLLGELSAEDAAALRQTISQDAALAKLHERLRLTLDLVRESAATSAGGISEQTAPLKLSPARREALLAHFKIVSPKELARPRARRVPLIFQLAAAAAILLTLTALLLPARSKSKVTFFVRASTADSTRLGDNLTDRVMGEGDRPDRRSRITPPTVPTPSPAGRATLQRSLSDTPSTASAPSAHEPTGASAGASSSGNIFEFNTEFMPASIPAPNPNVNPSKPARASPPRTPIYTGRTEESAEAGTAEQGLVLNLRNTTVDQVLDYLGESQGLKVIRQAGTSIPGTVDIVSETPLNKDETVALANKVLASHNLTAIQDNKAKTLTIETMEEAQANGDTRVNTATNWAGIPSDSPVVTEVIPVHTLNPTEVVKDFDTLLPQGAKMSASEAGNSVLMTGTQADIRRMSQAIGALDSTGNGNLQVSLLTYADSKAVASELNDLFSKKDSTAVGDNPFASIVSGRGGSATDDSKRVGEHVKAVSDDQNNAVLINAPADLMPGISNIISKLDIPQEDTTQMKLFFLTNADSTALANELKMAYAAPSGPAIQNANAAGSRGTAQFAGGASPSRIFNGGQPKEVPVNAVADPRTQSVLVTASKDTMAQIEQLVDRWDETPSVQAPASVNKFADDDRDVSLMLASPVAQNGSASTTTIGSTGGGGAGGSIQRGGGAGGGRGTSGNNLHAAQGQVGPVTFTVDPIAGGFRYFTAPNNTTNAPGNLASSDAPPVAAVYDRRQNSTPPDILARNEFVDVQHAGVVYPVFDANGYMGSVNVADVFSSDKLHSAGNQSGSGNVAVAGGGAATLHGFYDDNATHGKLVAGAVGENDNSRLDGVSPYRGEVADSGRRQTNGIVGNTPGNIQGSATFQPINADVLDLVGPLTDLFPQANGRTTGTASQQNALAQRMQTAAQQQSISAQTTIGSSSSGGVKFQAIGGTQGIANSGPPTATNGVVPGHAYAGNVLLSSAPVTSRSDGSITGGNGRRSSGGAVSGVGGLGERLDYGIPLNQGGGRGGGGGFGGPGFAAAPAQQHYFSNSAPISAFSNGGVAIAPAAPAARTAAASPEGTVVTIFDAEDDALMSDEYLLLITNASNSPYLARSGTTNGYVDTSRLWLPGTPSAEEAKRLPGTTIVGAIDTPRFVTSDSVGVNFSTRNGPTNATVDYDSLYAQDVAKQAQYANAARNREQDTKTELEQVERMWLLTDEASKKSQAATVLKSRVDSMGTAEPLLRSTGGENRLAAERALPAGADKAAAAKSFPDAVLALGPVAYYSLNGTNAPSTGKGAVDVWGTWDDSRRNEAGGPSTGTAVAYDIVGGFNGLYWTNSAQGAQRMNLDGALPSAETANNWSEVAQVFTPMTNGFVSAGTINLDLAREKKAPQLGDTPILGGLFKREVAAAPVAAPTTNSASGNNTTLRQFYRSLPETNRASSLNNGAIGAQAGTVPIVIVDVSAAGSPKSFARGDAAPTRGSTGVSPYPLAPASPAAAATNRGSKPAVMISPTTHALDSGAIGAQAGTVPTFTVADSSGGSPNLKAALAPGANPANLTFHFSMPADQVLNEVYGPLVGRTLSRTNAPDAADLKNTVITLDTKSALSKSNAITDLEAVLGMNGITVVPIGTNAFRAVNSGNSTEGGLFRNPQSPIRKSDAPPPKPAVPPPIPQPEVQTCDNAFSTFSLNVSDVSFKLAAASLQKGLLPEPATVRSEEFINAFNYRDSEPAPGAPIGFASERAGYPFAHNRDLLRFSVKTAAEGRQAGRPLNLVLLLDKSGSMERADRVAIIREALRVLAMQLQAQDTISVVVFSRTARLWADGIPGNLAAARLAELEGLTPEGGTNLEEAMRLAYETALRHYLANGENRVVLLTDGAANLGDVEPGGLRKKVEANRAQGIALDCFGVGWEDYNDNLLEVLSRSGGGRYGFVNTPEEAATGFAGQLAGALRVAASDVKVQVEFNPARVISWRQIGYAKDQLTKEQFRDNTVKAAQISVAESGNALYTVELNPAGDGPVCTVYVRYRVPGTSDYYEHVWAVPYTGAAAPLDKASPAMRLAAAATGFSEWLAGSPYAGEVTLTQLQGYLRGVPEFYGADTRPKLLETMLSEARSISGR